MDKKTVGAATQSGQRHGTSGLDELVLGSDVIVSRSGERGTIAGVVRWIDRPSQAWLRYVDGSGRAVEARFSFDEIEPAG